MKVEQFDEGECDMDLIDPDQPRESRRARTSRPDFLQANQAPNILQQEDEESN